MGLKRVRKTGKAATRYNRAMLKGAGDEGATPEFGRFASRPEGKTSKGKRKPARILPVDEEGREPTAAEIKRENEIATAYNRAMLKGAGDEGGTTEFGRFASRPEGKTSKGKRKPARMMPVRAKGGSVQRKAYANGGSVRAAQF